MAAAGNLAQNDLAWTDGMSEWKPVREALPELVALMAPASPPPSPIGFPSPNPALSLEPAPPPPPLSRVEQPTLAFAEAVPTYLWQSVAMTLLCCPLTGIPALVFASQVESRQQVGDIAGALKASQNARLWCWISLGAGVVMYVVTALVIALVVAMLNFLKH